MDIGKKKLFSFYPLFQLYINLGLYGFVLDFPRKLSLKNLSNDL